MNEKTIMTIFIVALFLVFIMGALSMIEKEKEKSKERKAQTYIMNYKRKTIPLTEGKEKANWKYNVPKKKSGPPPASPKKK